MVRKRLVINCDVGAIAKRTIDRILPICKIARGPWQTDAVDRRRVRILPAKGSKILEHVRRSLKEPNRPRA